MLSSLATFLFGAPAATCESASNSSNEVNPVQAVCSDPCDNPSPGDVIEVTSSTPSVAGNSSNRGPVRASPNGKRGKNRRGKQQRNNQQQQQQQQQQQRKQQPASITKLLTPTGETPIEEDFDEDEWYIVEKEDEEDDSLPRSDSEEELSVVEVQQQQQPRASSTSCHGQATSGSSRHRRQHINSHSLYSGPRPQQQRNHLQRSRVARPLSISTLSPPRSVPPSSLADLDNVSQSLYVASPSGSDHGQALGLGLGLGQGGNVLMEESCMSVYRSIRSTQEGAESFVNLDLGVAAEAPQTELQEAAELELALELEPEQAQVQVQARALHEQRPNSARFDRHAAAQLKQEALARQSQKSNNKKQHQQLCRSAIKRSNKVRDFQAKSHRPRRSEMQHCKLVSGANNNRKCCF
ncbi:transcription factor SPT20 homolog isoform X2 [Drosophila guanche]|uniref:transcription factor SPT20 homolog isoform X2 n=1 Tax=Drosophila guanche TaxID=7266 RepID=UPI001470FC45|nr:transcription factor SPT20 homolog isoform X2 [Drosophila guanche]